eukprot:6455664-Amphidinium_carterae.1
MPEPESLASGDFPVVPLLPHALPWGGEGPCSPEPAQVHLRKASSEASGEPCGKYAVPGAAVPPGPPAPSAHVLHT